MRIFSGKNYHILLRLKLGISRQECRPCFLLARSACASRGIAILQKMSTFHGNVRVRHRVSYISHGLRVRNRVSCKGRLSELWRYLQGSCKHGGSKSVGMLASAWICPHFVLLASSGLVNLQIHHFEKILSHKCKILNDYAHAQRIVLLCLERNIMVICIEKRKAIKVIWFLNQTKLYSWISGLCAIRGVKAVANRFLLYGTEMCITHGKEENY